MRGRSIYFTADEIAAMEKFFDDFDIYFSAEKHKEMYEYLLHNRMWLILRKFDVCNGSSGKGIYFLIVRLILCPVFLSVLIISFQKLMISL